MDFSVELTQTISERMAAVYQHIPEVEHVYLKIDGDTLFYRVFSSEEKYNDALLDRMIDHKMAVMNTFHRAHFDFHHVPLVSCPDPQECIPKGAYPIYHRD